MNWKSIFRRRFRPFVLDSKYRVVPAFEVGGVQYFMFDNEMEVPTGRQMSALFIYGEMQMRCSREYLLDHCRAMKKVLSDPKKIDLTTIMKLNNNLEERVGLMVLPEFIYKLASVTFFDKTESPYFYDIAYNEKKIQAWKEDGATLDFFSRTPLLDMIPSWREQREDLATYSPIAEMVSRIHQELVTGVLSERE